MVDGSLHSLLMVGKRNEMATAHQSIPKSAVGTNVFRF